MALTWLVLAVAAASIESNARPPGPPGKVLGLLVFSETKGYRHDAIPEGIAMMKGICAKEGWSAEFTEDSSIFEAKSLAKFDAAVFLLTTGDALEPGEEREFEAFIRKGGGYVGIHSASDTEYDWPFYGKLVGAYFESHPAIQKATVRIEDRRHSTVKHLGKSWEWTDEWYNFRANPRGSVKVLATVDESTYTGGKMEKDHPVIWCHDFSGGRAWYTALGHVKESYTDPKFVKMISEALKWASAKSKRK
jgi:type 1 glutamine amidotransferase